MRILDCPLSVSAETLSVDHYLLHNGNSVIICPVLNFCTASDIQTGDLIIFLLIVSNHGTGTVQKSKNPGRYSKGRSELFCSAKLKFLSNRYATHA